MPRQTPLLVLLLASVVVAQTGRPGIPGRGEDWYPLGGIEAMGDVTSDGIVVKKIHPGGLADKGKLKVGDVIYGAGNRSFSESGPALIAELERAIEKAECGKKRGKVLPKLKLRVRSAEGAKIVREVPVQALGPHSKSCPVKCRKCERVLKSALDYLKKEQSGDGSFPVRMANMNQQVATSALAGLAWRGYSKKKYGPQIKKAGRFCEDNTGKDRMAGMRPDGGANWNQTNWAYSYSTILLAELKAAKVSGNWTKPLQEFVGKLLENQEQSGGWAHGPGGPNALGYLELEIMSNLALGGIGMAQRVKVGADKGKIAKGVEFVKACTQGGGVAYSPKPGQFGHGDPGRTAGAYWAFRQLGRKEKVVGEMRKFYENGIEELPDGHASPIMHVLNGALASAVQGRKSFQKYWRIYRPFIMANRGFAGAFDARPSKESKQLGSNSDRSNGAPFVTAHYAIIMSLAQGRYSLLDVVK